MVTQSIGTRTRVSGSVDKVLQSGQGHVHGAQPPLAPPAGHKPTQFFVLS